MLPKPYRLKHRRDFGLVYQRGIRCNADALGLRAYQRSQPIDRLSCPRIGFSISQKVSKRAVVRNRLKRQLRAALRQWLPELAQNWDLVIVVYPNGLKCDYEEFLRQLKQLLIQAEILHGC
jgi:ribonuclease P protein component